MGQPVALRSTSSERMTPRCPRREPGCSSTGLRPRGVRQTELELHWWERDIAPSTELRKWFGHDPDRFEEFRARYLDELDAPQRADALARLAELACGPGLVIVTATAAVEISHAEVIRGLLSRPLGDGSASAKG